MAVAVGELRHVASEFDEYSDAWDRSIRDEFVHADAVRDRSTHAPEWTRLAGSGPASGSAAVPGWLAALDHMWQRHRARLVASGRAAAAELIATAELYEQTDGLIAHALSDDTNPTGHTGGADGRDGKSLDPGEFRAAAVYGPGDHARMASPSTGRPPCAESPQQLDAAITLWQVRVGQSADAVSVLDRTKLAVHAWRGDAGSAYGDWLAAHRERWQRLRTDAETIHHLLADQQHPAPGRGNRLSVAPADLPAPTLTIANADAPGTPPLTPGTTTAQHTDDRGPIPAGSRLDRPSVSGVAPDSGNGDPTPPVSTPFAHLDPENPSPPPDDVATDVVATDVVVTEATNTQPVLREPLPTYLPGDEPPTVTPGTEALPGHGHAAPTLAANSTEQPGQPEQSGTEPQRIDEHTSASARERLADDAEPDHQPITPRDPAQTPDMSDSGDSGDSGIPPDVDDTSPLPDRQAPAPPVVTAQPAADGLPAPSSYSAALAAGAGTSAATAASALAAVTRHERIRNIITDSPNIPLRPSPGPTTIRGTCTPPGEYGPSPSPPAIPRAAPPVTAPASPSGLPPWAASGATHAATALADGLAAGPPTSRNPAAAPRRPRPEQHVASGPDIGHPAQHRARRDLDPPTLPLHLPRQRGHYADRRSRIPVHLSTDTAPAPGGRAAAPVVLDLAATGGLGLTGPGGDGIARTLLWRLLVLPGPAPELVVPARVLGHLQAATFPEAADDHVDDPIITAGLHLVDEPFDALDALGAEIEHRRAHPTDRPWVLLAAAPRTGPILDQLDQLLTQARGHAIAAVLLGAWPPGTTLTITADHHVHHHDPAPRRPDHPGQPQPVPDLTGVALHATTAHDLTARLQTRAAADTTTYTDSEPPGTRRGPTGHGHDGNDDHDPAVDHDVDPGASAEPATRDSAPAASTPYALSVLGPITLRVRDDPEDPATTRHIPITPRPAELLAYLAAHPGPGINRDAIVETLWPDTRADREDGAMHQTLRQLRKTLARDPAGARADGLVVYDRTTEKYRLNDTSVTVDYWTYLNADRALIESLSHPDRHAAETLVGLYGRYADANDGAWLHSLRGNITRSYLTGINALVDHIGADEPDRAIALLEVARNFEPYNEAVYRSLMKLHHNNGRTDTARETYTLLRTQLAEIDTQPTAETRAILARINQHAHQTSDSPPGERQ